ncbi:MAG TPA: DUF835 domain-containing protein [Methanomassiliicoccales archaeon]|nr:DUF835 domain-containing protein [Methanomassiliicoccales archaeon]
MVGKEEFGAFLIIQEEVNVVSTFLHRLVEEGLDTVLVSPQDVDITSDADITILEPDRENRAIRTDGLVFLLRHLTSHLRRGEGKAVVIFGFQEFKQGNDFYDLTNFIGRLYEEACVNRGIVLIFTDPRSFTQQELAFLERETIVLESPEQLFASTGSETVK